MKIDQIFSIENFDDPFKIDWLKQEAGFFLKIMETRTGDVPAERSTPVLSPATLELYFRRKERSEKVCQIMQYLLAFLSHIPGKSEIEEEPVDPAEQFREFIRYETDLLLEEDVKNAVFQESNHKSPSHGGNVWDTQGRIVAMNRELRELAARKEGDTIGTLANLCRVLEQLCLFWFEIRRHDIRRTRRSDIYLYLLARLVQHRCRQARKPENPLHN
jgi:PAS domain-containing protein